MKLLVLRTGAMGDVVHALHAVAALRRARADWTIHWLADERWSPLLAGPGDRGPEVDRVITAPFRSWSNAPFAASTRSSLAGLRQTLRAERYDLAVDLQGTLRSGLLGFLSGAKALAGWTDPREGPARWFYHEAIPRQGRHFVEQTTALLAAATRTSLQPASPRFPEPPAEHSWVAAERQRLLSEAGAGRLALLAPGAGWSAKQWPAQRYAELAGLLQGRGFAVAVNATRADDSLAQAIAGHASFKATPLAMTIAQLIALLRTSDLVIGGDSGPLHLAAALRVPLVGLYGPTDPERNGPFGSGGQSVVLRHPSSATSYKRTNALDSGLSRITAAEVLAAVDRLPSGSR